MTLRIDSKQLRRLAREMSHGQIAARYGCNVGTVGRHLRKLGIRSKQGRRFKVTVKKTALGKAYRKAGSVIALAKELGCSPVTAWNALRRAGIKVRPPGNRTHGAVRVEAARIGGRNSSRRPDPDLLRDLYWNQGLNQTELARVFRVTQGCIANWFRRYGIPTRKGGRRRQGR